MSSHPRFVAPIIIILTVAAVTISHTQAAGLDLNGDGMSDAWQLKYNATSLQPNVDTDGDGTDNQTESIAGTNPFDPNSRLIIDSTTFTTAAPPANGSLNVSWIAQPGKQYQIQISTDLQTWLNAGAPITDASGPTTVELDLGPNPNSKTFTIVVASDTDADLDGLYAYEELLLGYSDTNPNSNTAGPNDSPLPGGDFTSAATLFASPGTFQLDGETESGTPPSLAEASRFLQQATMGSTYGTIQNVSTTGIPAWIEAQFNLPATSHVTVNNLLTVQELDENNEPFPNSDYIWTWWYTALNGNDALRQRVAFALSEFLVIGQTTDLLEDIFWGIATYYDILALNAFGNYRDILYQVTTNPAMGHYLSHVRNRPTDLTNNIFPDENFAREVMQLFSIGLFELNQDGSRKKDSEGNDIPTYDNTDITNFAKVFTGLTYNPQNPNNGTPYTGEPDQGPIASIEDYLGADEAWMGIEMTQYEPMHEPGVKNLLNNQSTNGNIQTNLNAAVDNLFNHPNVGPFIGRLLIQRLVTSNPSPQYIHRVAAAFNNNGSNVRGDMKAVLRAILLDPEARNRSQINNPHFGKLREPVLRHTHLARAFQYRQNSGLLRMDGFDGFEAYSQQPMRAPSVFNFYLPDHQPIGPIKDAGLVAPEFQITTATTTIKNLNFYSLSIPFDFLVGTNEEVSPSAEITNNYAAEAALVENNDINGLIDRLDILLTRGQMTATTRAALQTALAGAFASDADTTDIARFAVTLVASSPDFAVLR
ncbi:MAG: DUF1800 family protein [Verrucomicrobiota bacterium]